MAELFELYENKNAETLVAVHEDYSLFKENLEKKGFRYSVYDPDDALVYSWISFNDIESFKDIKKSPIYRVFLDEIEQDQKYGRPLLFDDNGELIDAEQYDAFSSDYEDPEDDDDLYYYSDYLFPRSNRSRNSFSSYYYSPSYYKPAPKKKGFFDELTKSDTLVFHKTDSTTTMLDQIYAGKGWDVLHSTYDLDEEELFKVVDAHKRIVCLGHGTPYGLMGMFGPEMAPHFKDKKLFIIWCNADAYFLKAGIGKGQFITGNMPSEVWECSGAGCGNISKELMLENITYWSKLCADVCEKCLNGDVKSSVDYVRKNYLEKYGNHPVTIYNCERTQCLGEPQPLPKFEFKGEPLTSVDYPVSDFDEEAFLQNPVASAADCPRITKEETKEEEKPEETESNADGQA